MHRPRKDATLMMAAGIRCRASAPLHTEPRAAHAARATGAARRGVMTAACCGLQCNDPSQALAERPHSPHQRLAIHLTTAVTRHPLLLRLPRCHVCSSLVPRTSYVDYVPRPAVGPTRG